jgi:selenide,water dikinase
MRRSRHPALGTVRSLRRGQVGAEPLRLHLVLAGGGHTHALLLRRWLMRPRLRPAHTLVTLVSRQSTAPYSGTLPALVAGLIAPQECAIDLRRLCALAGVSFLRAEIVGLDPLARELTLQGRPPLRFDRLSLDVGAVTAGGSAASGQAVKPLEPFLAWLSSLMPASELRIRGGGAAAVELALALRARGHGPRLLLRGQGLRLGSAAANRLGERLLAEAAIPLERNVPPEAPADLACTGSRAPAWLAAAGLPVDAATGRVVTTASLQVLEHPHLFAAGDCAVVAEAPRPASGVWAVRAAPLLAVNLQRSLEQPQRPLRPWRPQRRALQLLGDGGWSPQGPRAVAFWGPFALGPSRWLWRWKHQLDRGFLEGFTALVPMQPEAMACRGCAAKLAAAPLEVALARLEGMAMAQAPSPSSTDRAVTDRAVTERAATAPPAAPPPEDAAVLATAADGSLLLQSVDGFPALVADPWLNARLTTLHACGDLWASGAAVDSVQALVTLPEAEPALQEELLLQTLAGVRSVLDLLGARLIGGHTLEGRDGAGLALALTVNGRAAPGRHWPKGPLREGDALLLCGPLGSGVLFAAAAAGAARPGWIDAALETMQRSQAPLVALLAAHGCQACTDVTGFGLLGHLGEMLAAGGGVGGGAGGSGSPPLMVRLEARGVAAFDGALDLLDQGWASSLAPANARALALLQGPVRLVGERAAAHQALLIDPQTCGPLLAALPADRAGAALAALQRAGFSEAALIGRVLGAPQCSAGS